MLAAPAAPAKEQACLRKETSWLDWGCLDAYGDVFRFARLMIAFRKAHSSLCRSRFWRDDIRWYGVEGPVDLSHDSRSLAFCLRGASQGEDDVYVMINGYWEALDFTLQDGRRESGRRGRWWCLSGRAARDATG